MNENLIESTVDNPKLTAEKRQRRLVAIRNNPGIYKVVRFEKSTQKWIDSAKFLATRRSLIDGRSKREKAVFSNLADAKAFRAHEISRESYGKDVHKINDVKDGGATTFGAILEEWKNFHFLRIREGTRLLYQRTPTRAERAPVGT